jgi:methyl-accepting chemotaxis protein
MSSTGKPRLIVTGAMLLILGCFLVSQATPMLSQTDTTQAGISTKEKLLKLLGDSTAAAPKTTAPAARPIPAAPRETIEADRSVSPVADKNEIASARTREQSSAKEKETATATVAAPSGGGSPPAQPATPAGTPAAQPEGSSALWWQLPVACVVLAGITFLFVKKRAPLSRVYDTFRERVGLNSIRGKLIFVTLCLVVCAVGVTGYIAFDRGSAALVDGLEQNFQGIAVTTMDKIDRGLGQRYADVQAFASDPIVAATLSGKESPEKLRAFASELMRVYGSYTAMMLADRSGKVVAVAGPEQLRSLEGSSMASAPWYAACAEGKVKSGSAFAGAPIHDAAVEKALGTKTITMPFAAPVRDRAGNVIGVFCAHVDFKSAVQSMTDEAIAYQRGNGFPSFRITMIDKKGTILDDDAEADILVKNLAKAGNSQCVTRVLAGESGATLEKSVRFGYTQVNGFASSHGSGTYQGDRWGLLVRARTDDALTPVVALKNTLLIVGVVIGLISIIAVVVYSRRIIAPLRELAAAADQLATGDVNVSVAVSSSDEVGRLASSIAVLVNTMYEQAEIVDKISSGDLNVSVTPRSENDVVTIALGKAVQSLRGLTAESEALSKAAIEGKLSIRGDASKFHGVYREIVNGVNGTLDAVIGPLTVAAATVDRISKGDIPPRITTEYRGDFNALKNNLNQAIDAVNALVADADGLAKAALAGKINARADAAQHGGDFRKIVQGVNATLDSLVGFIDTMPLPVMVIDRDRTIQYMNTVGAAVANKRPAEVAGKKCYDHFRTPHCDSGECACLRAMASGKMEHGETIARPGADDLSINYTGVPIKNEAGAVVGALEIVVDQTAIKHAQAVADKVAAYQKVQVEMLADDLKKLSAGDLDLHLMVAPGDAETADVKRNFEIINERLDGARRAVTNLVADANMLSDAAVAGRLATRADATKHEGDFRRIVQGVNDTLDAVVKPVQEGSSTMTIMATGDLTVRMKGDYKGDLLIIKESINKVGASLQAALQKVSEAVSATASASGQISSSTEEMAAGSFEQTSQAGEVASAVEEMTRTILENAKNASAAADTAKQARVNAEQGGAVVGESIEGMKRIAAVVNRSAQTVKELGRSSDQIGEIIGVIEDIADQTNLLALNAAIEAARAGEQGRGFAVVADEVRKLAERTTRATKEITSMIKKIQADTTGAVAGMEEGTKEVEQGIRLADKAGASLQQIVGVSQRVTDMVTQIATASEEQSATSEQISKNVEGISKVTGETAQGTQQIARAAEDLNRLTENLQQMVAAFKLDGDDAGQSTHGATAIGMRERHTMAEG